MWLFDLLDAKGSKCYFSRPSVCNDNLSRIKAAERRSVISLRRIILRVDFEFANVLKTSARACVCIVPLSLRCDQHCPRGGGSPHLGQEGHQYLFS